MPKVAGRNGGVREETLAARLAEGPLPLPLALRCATDVAAALRELHEIGRAHGDVSPASVVLRPAGAALLAPNGLQRKVDLSTDVAAFGALLREMLTGGKSPGGGPLAAPEERVPHSGVPGLRAAATRLAAKCLAAPPGQPPTIQMVVTEVRLLNVLARQSGAEWPPPRPAPASGTRRQANPLAEWTAATEPPQKPERTAPTQEPERTAPAENFVRAAPARNFVRAIMSRKPAPSPAPHVPGANLPEEEEDGGPDVEDEIHVRVPSPLERCPRCGSGQIHESHPRTKLEFLFDNVGIPLCRCHRCWHRYVVVFRLSLSKNSSPK